MIDNPVDWNDFYVFRYWIELFFRGEYTGLYSPSFYLLFSPFFYNLYIFIFINLFLFVYNFKRKSFLYVFHVSFWHVFLSGQVDLFFLTFKKISNPLGMALLTLKPQLFIISLQKFSRFRPKDYLLFFLYVSILYLPSFIFFGNWIYTYTKNISNSDRFRFYFLVTSFFGENYLIIIPLIFITLLFLNKQNWHYILGIFLTEVLMVYNYIFYDQSILTIPLSWLCVYLQDPKGENNLFYFAIIPAFLFFYKGAKTATFRLILIKENSQFLLLNFRRFFCNILPERI